MHYLHHHLLLILGGSLCEDLGLFHSFKTSPRSSNSESVCQSYQRFSGLLLAVLGTPLHGVFDPRGHGAPCARGLYRAHGTPWARGLNPRAHGVPRKCPLEPQRLVSEFGYLRPFPPTGWGLVLTLSKHHFEPLYTSPKALSPLYVKGDLWMDL